MREPRHRILVGTAVLVACITLGVLSPVTAVAVNGLPTRTPAPAGKLSTRLQALARPPLVAASPARQARALGLPVSGPGSLIRSGSSLLVYVSLTDVTQRTRTSLSAAGLRITHVTIAQRTVTGLVEPRRLRELATVGAVQRVSEALRPITSRMSGRTTW